MNNTEKLDGIKRTLRRIETQAGIIQRINVIMFERITGGAFPPNWIIHEDERAVLSENEPVTHDQLSTQLEEHTGATTESLEPLTGRIARIEKQLGIGNDETLSPVRNETEPTTWVSANLAGFRVEYVPKLGDLAAALQVGHV